MDSIALLFALLAAANSGDEAVDVSFPENLKGVSIAIVSSSDLVRLTEREQSLELEKNSERDRPPQVVWHRAAGTIKLPKGAIDVRVRSVSNVAMSEQLSALSALDHRNVRRLLVFGKMAKDDCNYIGRFTHVVDLQVDATEAWESAGAAAQLSKLSELQYLRFKPGGIHLDQSDWDADPFGSVDLARVLSTLPKLRFLSLPCDKLKEDQLTLLSSHPSLESLTLIGTKPIAGPKALKAFANTKKLRELFLTCSDEITNGDVMAFAKSPTLEAISLRTNADITCVPEFRRSRPDCIIHVQPLGRER